MKPRETAVQIADYYGPYNYWGCATERQHLAEVIETAIEDAIGEDRKRRILVVHAAAREHVQEAYEHLGALLPQFTPHDNAIIKERVRTAHMILKLALEE